MPTDAERAERAIELFEMAGVHDSAGRESEAEGPYREAIHLGLPADLDLQAHVQLASTLRNLGKVDEAVAMLLEATATHPDHRAARMFLSLALLSDDQPAAAVYELLDLLLTNPGPPERYERSLRGYADDLIAKGDADSES